MFKQRESNTEKRMRLNLKEMEKMFQLRESIERFNCERVENVGLESMSMTKSKFIIYCNFY